MAVHVARCGNGMASGAGQTGLSSGRASTCCGVGVKTGKGHSGCTGVTNVFYTRGFLRQPLEPVATEHALAMAAAPTDAHRLLAAELGRVA
eukprot:scaffold47612_cov57-Phaeocystis_antarctica.AAC.1